MNKKLTLKHEMLKRKFKKENEKGRNDEYVHAVYSCSLGEFYSNLCESRINFIVAKIIFVLSESDKVW